MPAFTGPDGPNQAVQERDQQRRQAAASPVFFTVTAHTAGPLREARETAGQGGAGPSDENVGEENDPNQQAHKRAFLHGPANTATVTAHRLQPPISPYVIQAGTVLAAALVTGLNSDLPGQVIAQVTEDIYSVTGRFLLIPQGARLLGTYDSAVTYYGQSRILVVWTRLLLPNGKSLVLDRLSATNTEGHAGLEDEVDYHTGRLLRGMGVRRTGQQWRHPDQRRRQRRRGRAPERRQRCQPGRAAAGRQ